MYVNREISKNFFYIDNQPIITGFRTANIKLFTFGVILNLIKHILPSNTNFFVLQKSSLNYLSLLNSRYYIKLSHVAIPLTKTLYKDTIKKFYKEWEITSSSKCRSSNDIRPTYLLANFSKYFTKYGNNRGITSNNVLFYSNSTKIKKKIKKNIYLFGLIQINYSIKSGIENWFFDKHKIKPYKSK